MVERRSHVAGAKSLSPKVRSGLSRHEGPIAGEPQRNGELRSSSCRELSAREAWHPRPEDKALVWVSPARVRSPRKGSQDLQWEHPQEAEQRTVKWTRSAVVTEGWLEPRGLYG